MTSARLRRLVVAVALVGAACAKRPPPKPPTPAAPEKEEPPPPPPPKCEAIEEACSAAPDTKARVPGVKLAFTPPPGWVYAQEPQATVATKGRAALVLVSQAMPNAKKPPRAEALGAVVERLAATFPKVKGKPKWPKKADRVLKVGGLDVSLFQLDGAKRDGAKGPVLVFSAAVGGDRLVVGGGFVPEDDDSNADAQILGAIQSLVVHDPDAEPAKGDAPPSPP